MTDFPAYKIKEWNAPDPVRNPARRDTIAPSPAELDFYTKYLKQIKEKIDAPRLLVLGATPELRDLGLNLGFAVTAVDINPEMIKLADKSLTVKNRKKEEVILGDWLEVSLPNGSFDAVLGDVALNNVTAESLPRLLEKMAGWLKPGGLVLVRNIVLPADVKEISRLADDLRLWREGKMAFREFYFRFRFGHCYPDCYEEKSRIIDAGKEYQWLDRLYQDGVFNPEEYDQLNLRRSVILHTVLPIDEFLKITAKYFTPVEAAAEVEEKFGFYPVKMFGLQKG